jgi:hypothetical protein
LESECSIASSVLGFVGAAKNDFPLHCCLVIDAKTPQFQHEVIHHYFRYGQQFYKSVCGQLWLKYGLECSGSHKNGGTQASPVSFAIPSTPQEEHRIKKKYKLPRPAVVTHLGQ